MNGLKKIIMFMVIIIVILIFCLTIIVKKDEKDKNQENVQKEVLLDYENTTLEDVTNATKFYTVTNCVYAYLDKINLNNSSYYGYDDNGKYTMIADMSDIKNEICDLLDKDYIEDNKVTSDNVLEYINTINEKVFFIPLKMKVLQKEDIEKYIVYGFIEDLDYNYLKDIYIIVNLDSTHSTFSIEPVIKHYNSIEEIKIMNENIEIEKNENNTFELNIVGYEDQCKNYINNFKKIMLGNIDLAYNYLDKEYRDRKFGSLEQFKKYIKDNFDDVKSINITQYSVNHYKDNIEYIGKDKYENLYIFDSKSLTDYTVKLDTYTIETDKFKATYENSNDQGKVMLNIDKWRQMINNRDYHAAYEVLDETFRNNYFGSEEKFEQYMRQSYPLHYSTQYVEFSNEGNTYIQKIQLSDITGEDTSTKEMKIVMRLNEEGTGFTMSFT